MRQTAAFPFNDGVSDIERAHPHIVNHLRLLWGYPEGGRYLAKLIIDSRGDRAGFSPAVMSELLTLANLAANPAPAPRNVPFASLAASGHAGPSVKIWGDPSLHPISYQPGPTGQAGQGSQGR